MGGKIVCVSFFFLNGMVVEVGGLLMLRVGVYFGRWKAQYWHLELVVYSVE